MAHVIFERCWKREKCVTYRCPTLRKPNRKCDHCVGAEACVTIEEEGNAAFIVIKIGRITKRHKIVDTCYPAVVYGAGTVNVCTREIKLNRRNQLESVKLTVELCVGFSFLSRNFSKCWKVFSQKVNFARHDSFEDVALTELERSIISANLLFAGEDETPVIEFFDADESDDADVESNSDNGTSQSEDAERPTFKNLSLPKDCIDTLKLIDAKHEAGAAARRLFAWAPLIALASDPALSTILVTIATADWPKLVDGITGLRVVELRAIAKDCDFEQTRHHTRNERDLTKFWKAMYEFYRDQADALDRN